MSEDIAYPDGFSEQDILFECPNCSKSLGIDRRGGGLIVTCPDCGARLRVPIPEGFEPPAAAAGREDRVSTPEAGLATQEEAHRLEISLESLQRRKDDLERERVQMAHRIERLREQMAVVQTALDRMVEILQDIETGPGPA